MGIRVRVSTGGEGGILRMVGWSVGGHIAFTIALVFLPRFIPRDPPPPILMTADIVSADQLRASGGPPAPVRPARTGPSPEERARRAREAEKVKEKPPEPPPETKPEPRREPTKEPPEKAEEAPEPVKADPSTPPPPGEKPDEEKKAAPVPQPTPPAPAAEPAAPLQEGVGLGASGGGGDSDIPHISSASFPYNYYRSILVSNIRARWNRPLTPGLRETMRCAVSFVISRRGLVSDVALSVPSGFPPLDESAVQAVLDSSPLPPLPYQYTTSSVRAEMIFELTPE